MISPQLWKSRLAKIRRWLCVPFLVWALSWLLTGLAAGSVDEPWPRPGSFHRKDSHLYLSIVREGYTLFPCEEKLPEAPPGLWCGNAGWFPGYPALVGMINPLIGSLNLSGVLLSGFGTLAVLVLLWNVYLGAKVNVANIQVMALAGVFPGGIYYHAIFPLSLFLALALLCLWLYRTDRLIAAGLVGMAAASTYSTGFLLAGVIGVDAIIARMREGRRNLARAGIAAGLVCLGFGAVLLLHHLTLGEWDAFFKIQGRYGHGLHNPLFTLIDSVRPIFQVPCPQTRAFPSLQTCFVVFLLAACGLTAIRRRPANQKDSSLQRLVGLYVGLYWIFPLTMGPSVSMYRAEALLLPLVLFITRAPRLIRFSLLIVSGLFFLLMSRLFFLDLLV